MATASETSVTRPAWFVGAAYGGVDDQTERFLRDGVWVNGYEDEYSQLVRSILPGDRIAIKSSYTRNRRDGLPFDNRRHYVSVMEIKAVGTVTANPGDGRNLVVDWARVDPPREWYFTTSQKTVWKVVDSPANWKQASLIRFTFQGERQDIDRFRNDPYWRERFGDDHEPGPEPPDTNEENGQSGQTEKSEPATYTIRDIISDGCFIEQVRLEMALERLTSKKNLILQGPPGTGKTWLAKKLAFALIGSKAGDRVHSYQFHPNLSYEDFVRGWRPEEGGRLSLVDGPLLKVIEMAQQNLGDKHVIVIEEINRGNPAQVFGEMLTLLEADKRNPEEALALGYSKTADERVYVPPNVYIIGTMNVADRSIALVDLALRRRFAFVDLEPTFGELWHRWVSDHCDVEAGILDRVEERLQTLNQVISTDPSLGPQFRIGHSVVTPDPGITVNGQWFLQVVQTEIGPLLDEYWFDALEKAKEQKEKLLDGVH